MPFYTINTQTMATAGPLSDNAGVKDELEGEDAENFIVATLDESGSMSAADAEDWLDENGESED